MKLPLEFNMAIDCTKEGIDTFNLLLCVLTISLQLFVLQIQNQYEIPPGNILLIHLKYVSQELALK